jgi:hypothetical protein
VFTGVALRVLQDGHPELACSAIVGQAADYYFSKWPGIGVAEHYDIIGRKMFPVYQCIQQEGRQPWVCKPN